MHALVFEVEMKDGWEATVDKDLDFIADAMRSAPGFTRGTWMTDGRVGLAFILFESKEVAQEIADNAELPPDATAILRSASVHQVLREA